MRVCSRELFVGFLLVLAMAASGCQAVQPITATPTIAANEPIVESGPVTDTATLNESAPISASVAITATATSTQTDSVTETTEVTSTAEVSGTEVAAPTESSAPADPALLAAGMAVYRAQYCGVCHTLDAAETRGTFGPPHNGMGALAAERLQDGSYNGAATTAAEYIHESIVEPQVYTVPGYATTSHRMPSYAHLDDASLDALVAFLLAQ